MSVETKGDITISVDSNKLSGLLNKVIVWSPNEGVIDTCSVDRAVEISVRKGLFRSELYTDDNSQVKTLCWRRQLQGL